MPQLRGVQPSSTAGPNTHKQIGPWATAVCVKLCGLDKSLAACWRSAMSLTCVLCVFVWLNRHCSMRCGQHTVQQGRSQTFSFGEATGGASFATRGAVNGLCRTFRKRPTPVAWHHAENLGRALGGPGKILGGSGPPGTPLAPPLLFRFRLNWGWMLSWSLNAQPQFCLNLNFYLFHICRRGRNLIAVRRWVWRLLSLFL